MTDAEIVRLVAEKLMGWTVCLDEGCDGMCRKNIGICDDGLHFLSGRQRIWNPLTDANDDVAVLDAVREKWDTARKEQFFDKLSNILVAECFDGGMDGCDLCSIAFLEFYRCGFCTRAAAAVLEGGE